jgi:hypothetical protein
MLLSFQKGAEGDSWLIRRTSIARPSGAALAGFSRKGRDAMHFTWISTGRLRPSASLQQPATTSNQFVTSLSFLCSCSRSGGIEMTSSTRPAESFCFNDFVRKTVHISSFTYHFSLILIKKTGPFHS